jgi:hypothetical protein
VADAAVVALAREQREQIRLLDVRDAAALDPKPLINEIRYFDPVTQKWVEFRMFPPEGWESPISWKDDADLFFSPRGAADWYWQAVIIDWLHDPDLHAFLIYKARQLGITLLACAYSLWLMLYRPGSTCAAFSYEEGEAFKLTQAVWEMFKSLPKALTDHVEVLTPSRGKIPTEWMRLRHDDGRISSFQALPATGLHGHGSRVTFGIMDELAKQRYGRQIYEAIVPATLSRGGKMAMISTADGVSDPETGEGNFFHHLYSTRKEKGLRYVFLPWNAEPTRSEDWYQAVAMKLPEIERNRQYPLNETDGFVLSGSVYFDRDALAYYRQQVIAPKMSGQFVVSGNRSARFMRLADGVIDIFEKPKPDGQYAIGVDTATGRSSDYTVATVIDLSSGTIVAVMRAKMEAPRAAVQVHFLGKWYNTAKVCVERQGGYGEALIIALRDGNRQLPPYSNLYRHVKSTSGNRPISEEYGHPMGPRDRGTVLEQLKRRIYERLFPFMPATHMNELQTFAYMDTIPSPRAQDGCNDDCVVSLALATEMYRQFGYAPDRQRKWKKAKYSPPPTRR